jgi:DNA-binding beta-propeller fold protein YncE
MTRVQTVSIVGGLVIGIVALGCGQQAVEEAARSAAGPPPEAPGVGPSYQVDPFWPQELPNDWLLGQVIGVAVDSRDHIWVLQRPRSLGDSERGAAANPPTSECCVPAPAVIEFDPAGNVVQAWGGPDGDYAWPSSEHGLFIDYMDNVWVGGNGENDGIVVKLSRDGTFLLQIGDADQTGDSNNTSLLRSPADIAVDPEANEVYIADGYGNRRVIVFDADTGTYKRHWGAYGEPPVDGPLTPYDPDAEASPIFGDTVHCVTLSNEGLVYVCDRMNHRLQVFQKNGSFVTEGFIGRQTAGASVWDIDFSPDAEQSFVYNADGGNHRLWMVQREGLETIDTLGRRGRNAGQFESPHSVAVDSNGNMYVGEILDGRRMQKFVPIGQSEAP